MQFGIEVKGVDMYQYDQRPGTNFSDESSDVISDLRGAEYAVLVGRNNCGKSFLLKTLTQKWGNTASYIGPARYQNFNLLGYYTPNRNKKDEKWRQFMDQWQRQQQNIDNSPINLQQAIAELSNTERDRLSEITRILLGVTLDIRHTVEDNSMSQKYISCSGHNISYTSSGFRLITTLVTSLLNTDYDTYLIDEPELGISPEAQGVLADFLFDRAHRSKYFPHIKTLILATHSTIFLDRNHISNNYTVEKTQDAITVRRVSTQQEFNKIHFFLLGNRFETLYLPSLIILVEGKTDHAFISKALSIIYPNHQLSIINATSDSRMKEILSMARNLLTDIQRSPYRDRIIAVLDSVHGAGLRQSLTTMGLNEENIVVWTQNGIEHIYPEEILNAIFGSGGSIAIDEDIISRNGTSYKKAELSEKVCARLTANTKMTAEFDEKFLSIVRKHLN
jgi:predicted ATP-dependent endonuclease of OLD family